MELFKNIIVYPSADNKLDCRPPTLDAYMLVCFDYIQEPETDEAIIKNTEDRFHGVDFEAMKIKPVSEQLRTRNTHTTFFKEKISLS